MSGSGILGIVDNHDILMRLASKGIETAEALREAEADGKLSQILGQSDAKELSRRIHSNDRMSSEDDWP